MNRLMRRYRLGWVVVGVLALALVAAACEEDGDDIFDPVNEPTPVETPADPDDDSDAPPEPRALRGEVVEVDASGVFGEVMVTEFDDEVHVIVTLTGVEEGTYGHEIRAGSCAALSDDDEVVHELEAFEAEEAGHASAAVEVVAAFDDLETGHYYAVLSEDGVTVACADFELEDDAGAPANGAGPDDDDDEGDGNGPAASSVTAPIREPEVGPRRTPHR